MTRTTVRVNGEKVFDAFHDSDVGKPVRIVGADGDTVIETRSWVDIDIVGDERDEPWDYDFSVELNGETEYENSFSLRESINIEVGRTELQTNNLRTIKVLGELVE